MPFKKTNSRDAQQAVPAKSIFVGRADHLRYFIQNILQPEDPTHNIISISGQGGVGKTTLLQRFLDEARIPDLREYCLTALVNERQTTPASVMERFADQFRELGHPFKKFEEALIHYKEALRRMHATGAGYRDEQEMVVREVIDTTGTIMEDLPFAGTMIHKGANTLTDLMLERGYRRQFLKDAARLEDPIGDLTVAFVKELNQLADSAVSINGTWNKRQRRTLLFFDTFEQLAPDISPWLLNHFLEMDVSTNVVLVIAGRDSIEVSLPDDPKRWLPLLDSDSIHLVSLNAFTTEETQAYLEQRGITDPERIRQINQLSRGLPLYLSMLTSNSEGRIDPNAEVVENFLRWIPRHEHSKRQLALNASLFSLPFSKDDLAAFAYDEPERSNLYTWIISQPFVQSNTQDGRHTYHDLARDLFRRHLYQRSPEDYYAARKALADHYQARLAALQSDNARATYKSQPWQELALALIQQLFHLPNEASHLLAIEYVLRIKEHSTQDDELIRVLDNFLSDELNQQITVNAQNIVKQLLHYLKEDADDQYQQWFTATNSLLDRILRSPSFSPEALAYLYSKKGRIYTDINEYQRAIVDFSQALTLIPDYVDAYDDRGETYRLMGQYEEALTDFNQAIALDEKDAWAIASRGQAYQAMERYEEALADFDRAIALNEKYSWAIVSRGHVYQAMRRYEEAVADFDRAIALDERADWAIAHRGETYRQMERYEEALVDFDRAIELNEQYEWAIARRGETYRLMKHNEEALIDFNRAIALDEKDAWSIGIRGQVHRAMEQYEEALADFNRAIMLNEKYSWAIANRGRVYLSLKRYEEALADFNQAIMLNEKDAWAIANRGETYWWMERYEEALADFDRAIALDEKYSWAIGSRGEMYLSLERYEEALADFDRAIALDEKYSWAIANRGETYRLMKRYEEALLDFDRAIALDEKYDWAIANRGETYLSLERYEEAVADFDRAIMLDEKSDWGWYDRSLVYLLTGRLEAFHQDIHIAIVMARAQLEQVVAEDIEYYRIRFNIALYLLIDGSTDLAEVEYSHLMSICPFVSRLRAAAGDLKEFLNLWPAHEAARQMLSRVEASIEEFRRSVR